MWARCWRTRKLPGCGSRSSAIIRSMDQRSASLSASFLMWTIGGSIPSRILAWLPLEAEVSSDAGDVSSSIPDGDAPVQRPLIHRPEVDRRQGEVARQAKRPPQWEEEAIARLEVHRLGNALHDKPALAGDNRIALDAVVLGELERPVPAHIEAAAHRVLWFQERQHA